MSKSIQELLDEYNARSGKPPLKTWKQSREKLQARVDGINEMDKLNAEASRPKLGSMTEISDAMRRNPEQELPEVPASTAAQAAPKKEKVMAAKKTSKKPAKKAAAKKVAKAAPKARADGMKAFVVEQVGKGKGTKEIFEAATEKGFETTYKSVASMVCRAKQA